MKRYFALLIFFALWSILSPVATSYFFIPAGKTSNSSEESVIKVDLSVEELAPLVLAGYIETDLGEEALKAAAITARSLLVCIGQAYPEDDVSVHCFIVSKNEYSKKFGDSVSESRFSMFENAVKATAGMILYVDGYPFQAEFKRGGSNTFDVERASALSIAGFSYKTILSGFFPEASLIN